MRAGCLEEIGFDGFRYDMVKGYGGWMVRSIQELRALRGGTSFKPYAVGECWDSERTIDDWLDEANAWSDNPVGAFDFPLRWRLRDLCDSYGFSLRALVERDVLMWDRPAQAVTFVENHDVVRDTPIINNKLLAYALSSLTKAILVCSGRITSIGTWRSRKIRTASTRSSKFTNKTPAARRKCSSWMTISTSCNAQAQAIKPDSYLS